MKNKKLKLMIVAPYFYPKIRGLKNYAYNIAKGMKKNCLKFVERYDWDEIVGKVEGVYSG